MQVPGPFSRAIGPASPTAYASDAEKSRCAHTRSLAQSAWRGMLRVNLALQHRCNGLHRRLSPLWYSSVEAGIYPVHGCVNARDACSSGWVTTCRPPRCWSRRTRLSRCSTRSATRAATSRATLCAKTKRLSVLGHPSSSCAHRCFPAPLHALRFRRRCAKASPHILRLVLPAPPCAA